MLKKIRAAVLATAVALSLSGGVAATAQAVTLRQNKCALGVMIARPHPGQREILVLRTTTPGTRVHVHIAYKTRAHDLYLTTGALRVAMYAFRTGNPTKNFRVVLTGTVLTAPAGYIAGATCKASFTP